jgi:opacity protein-like surface antigen
MPSVRSKFHQSFLFLILLILVYASLACAADIATIKLKSGEVYKDVSYEVNDFYKTILFIYEGQRINIEFGQIESITVTNSQDISSQVLNSANSKIELVPIENQIAPNPWRVLFSFGGNFSAPASDYYEGLEAGLGFDVDLRIKAGPHLALQFIVSRSGMKPKQKAHFVSNDPNWTILNEDIGFRIMRYEMAFNFFSQVHQGNAIQSVIYGLGGLGIVQHKITAKATAVNSGTGEIALIDDSDSETRFTILLGAGVTAMFTKHYGLDLSGTVDLANKPATGFTVLGLNFAPIVDLKLSAVVMF